jgi:glutamate synthase domain-containing protein 2/glutamate synthase domain-containing protein 1/glutamate synthase domain-containing protein 3
MPRRSSPQAQPAPFDLNKLSDFSKMAYPHERDACGIGFIADIHGRKTHDNVARALVALNNLTHRGAVSADGRTGDGAGVLTQIPHKLFREVLASEGKTLDQDSDLAVGVFFIAKALDLEGVQQQVEDVVKEAGLEPLLWRAVPIDPSILGEDAQARCPYIYHLLLRRPADLADGDAFERRLYLVRKRIEARVEAAKERLFYIPSLSHRTISYKGLMVGEQMGQFYRDLLNPNFETAIALFHQRYSTNTFPRWSLAQPFRFLAHNGEINTIQGNVNFMRAREPMLSSQIWGDDVRELLPIIETFASDSSALDNSFELLMLSGRDPLHTIMMLVPEAYEEKDDIDPDVRAFYEYHSALMEPWDGPAAMVFSDGRYAVAALDRNGLRPQRYWLSRDGIVLLGSEAGMVPFDETEIVEKGRLGPGTMLAVDTETKQLLYDRDIKQRYATRKPYRAWVANHMVRADEVSHVPSEHLANNHVADDHMADNHVADNHVADNHVADNHVADNRAPTNGLSNGAATVDAVAELWSADKLLKMQRLFGYHKEDYSQILEPMVTGGKIPVGSMGDDTPLAILSQQPQQLYRYFKQRFAQVTNPPIDPLRERLVMSLETVIGPRASILDEDPNAAKVIKFTSPILDDRQFAWLSTQDHLKVCSLQTSFDVNNGEAGLEPALEALCDEAVAKVDNGCGLLVLSDRNINSAHAPIPMLLATAAVHHRLLRAGKRTRTALVVESGEPREDHHFACLIGYGAALVYPYLAYQSAVDVLTNPRLEHNLSPSEAQHNYRSAVEKGILKIMSKMGISTISSYRGAQIFEAVGVSQAVIDRYFTDTPSRVGGALLTTFAHDALVFHQEAFEVNAADGPLVDRGIYRFRKSGEYHALNPQVFKSLHKAVRTQSFEAFEKYSQAVDERPRANLRDLLTYKKATTPLPLDEVEPIENIVTRFTTQAMSHGSVSRETHETLAIAMNRLGAKSNSGEGGEDVGRFYKYERDMPELSHAPWHPKQGDWANSAIKQVASGRFGVTPHYLVNARELEIKMAQGSKPGEGGQIPGHKVNDEIAHIRRSVPGVTLISPPPHHDIYSIEDLAQLIYDLKRVNRFARVGVKLVATAGVGTIAAGVAKGYADNIQISGHDGGTGASPLSSMKHAGVPWELGLAETQQVLVENDLRGRVSLRVDGGMKTGRDVIMAALLGAEEFGFGTTALVAAGCAMIRQCHLNTCPVGVATQRPDLRAKFPGEPDHVVNFVTYVAQQVRMILAEMGFRSLDEVIGQTNLLTSKEVDLPKISHLDLTAILRDPDPAGIKPRRSQQRHNDRPEESVPLDELIWQDCAETINSCEPFRKRYPISNRERSVGARLSGEIARVHRDEGLPAGTIELIFEGVSGQSFGLFNNRGVRLILTGEAQDYVGKGMYGGEIVVRPRAEAGLVPHEHTIIGNTVLYGATGGSLYAAGQAGERLCVRNSGAHVVVEGCGDHGCEYMTGGVAVVLGATGRNFGAGMSGGLAYVLDEHNTLPTHVNSGMVGLERVTTATNEQLLKAMIERHYDLTKSPKAKSLLNNWQASLGKFWKVAPHPVIEDASAQERDVSKLEMAALEAIRAEANPVVSM